MCRPNDWLPCIGRRIPEPEADNLRAPSMAADFVSKVDVPGWADQGKIWQRFGHEAQRGWAPDIFHTMARPPHGRIPFIGVAEHRLIRIEGAHSMQTNAARVRRPRRRSRRMIATMAACLATILTAGIVVVAPANAMPSRPSLTAAALPLTMSIGGSGLYTESFTVGLSGVSGRQVVVRYAGRTWNARLNTAGKASATLPVNNGLRAGSYQISGTYVGTTKDAVVKTLTIRSNTKTSLSLDRSIQAFLGTPANVRLQVRGFDGAAPTGTFIVYRNNKPFARRFTNSDGRASIPVPANLGVGMQSFTVRFLPRDNHYLTSRAGSSLLSVTKGTTSATMSLSSRVVVDYRARMTLQVRAARGPATGNVTIKSGPGVLAVRRLDSRGMSYLDLPAYSSGTYTITVVFAGNGALKGSSVQRKMTIVRAAPKISLSAKASGSSVRISSAVSGSYGSPTSKATVYLDGHARATVPASGGSVTFASLAAGRHVVNVQYPGDVRYQPATAATAVTSATNPCSPSARACVDLTHNLTWLQVNGRITYGPVSMQSGRPGYRTETGTFAVYWKDINHHSSIFDNAPMPYAIFFDGGTAFHQGSLYVESHGCVHLSSASAQYYWRALDYRDVVQVFGQAPY